ncbi:dual specificity phosphatase 19-like [Brachionus plicatilis]|uniref:protein-serine/threonine phosphatase n=1 Tax=Brachionus plicatilis TaxID=10195 RepID=A0A3M7R808_BRAPC|nr:dual specificity phosphatase 19-like [Brachionus plicatilis]
MTTENEKNKINIINQLNDEQIFFDRLMKQNLELYQMNKIIPGLYLGDDFVARKREILSEYKITHVLNLTINIPNKFEPEISYLKINILDSERQDIQKYFDDTFEFIDNALKNKKNSVLVHCNAGISRSASFVIAYLIKKGVFKSYQEAFEHVKKCRPIIAPNQGFVKQLQQLESYKKDKNSFCIIS